eukprot:scaffold152075_cov31-Tisochrysis_lutea.AAC.1
MLAALGARTRAFSGRCTRLAAGVAATGLASASVAIASSNAHCETGAASDGVYVEMRSSIFVINGFYMAMREKFTKPDASIYYYLVEWEPEKLSWADFRDKVLGSTDPKTAAAGSARREIFTNWKSLGLAAEPNVGDNGMHASASPFEAMAERLNWMGATVDKDPFGKAMLDAGIPKATILEWTKDPQVTYEGKKASLFDLLEDLDNDACLEKAQKIAGVSGPRPKGKMQAFVFVKPHAVTDQVKQLAQAKLKAAGITVCSEGSLTGPVIEKNLLIDNHYYAIANKASVAQDHPCPVNTTVGLVQSHPNVTSMYSRTASGIACPAIQYAEAPNRMASLSKPKDLNPPAPKRKEFKDKFGISWEQAIADGVVYNAVDACERLGIDGDQMDKLWANAKKSDNLVKVTHITTMYTGRVAGPGVFLPPKIGAGNRSHLPSVLLLLSTAAYPRRTGSFSANRLTLQCIARLSSLVVAFTPAKSLPRWCQQRRSAA